MKLFLGIGIAGILLVGCAREENSGYISGSAPAVEQGSAQNNPSEIPNTAGSSTRLNSILATNAGPDTGVGAATAASSGVGTATASGSTAIETEAAGSKERNQVPASTSLAGTGARNPSVNSNSANSLGNASGTPQDNGSNR